VALSEAERVKIRHHLGYLNVGEAYTFVLGAPAAVETTFIIEGAMNRVLEAALPELRRLLSILDQIEEQMINDHELLAVKSLGEITVNEREQAQLTDRYDYWVAAIANILGCERNPFDKRRASASINVGVM